MPTGITDTRLPSQSYQKVPQHKVLLNRESKRCQNHKPAVSRFKTIIQHSYYQYHHQRDQCHLHGYCIHSATITHPIKNTLALSGSKAPKHRSKPPLQDF